jgi:hypothetical protein
MALAQVVTTRHMLAWPTYGPWDWDVELWPTARVLALRGHPSRLFFPDPSLRLGTVAQQRALFRTPWLAEAMEQVGTWLEPILVVVSRLEGPSVYLGGSRVAFLAALHAEQPDHVRPGHLVFVGREPG